MRCPRCRLGFVVSTSASSSDAAATTTNTNTNTNINNDRPTSGPYVDISLTLSLMPSELKCRSCGWTREGDGTSFTSDNIPFADSSSEFTLMPLSEVPLHPGLEASGRNDDLVQRAMRLPGAVLCTVCGGPSARVEEDVVKTALSSFKHLPQPPNDIETRESWWGFQSSNFVGRPVILEWYYVVTRSIDGRDAQQDDLIDLCVGCGRCCYAKYIAPREVKLDHANKTAPLSADWAEKQKQRELESRRRNPKYKKAERAEDGSPVPGTGGLIDPEGNDEEEEDGDDDDDGGHRDENGMMIRRLDNTNPSPATNNNNNNNNNNNINAMNNMLNGDNNNQHQQQPATEFRPPHDHTTGAAVVARSNNNDNNNNNIHNLGQDGAPSIEPPAAVVADPEAVRSATVARLVSVQQVRILEEARKHVVTHLDDVMGPPSTWPRTPEAVAAKPHYRELWNLASMIWILASSSPTKTGAMLEWSIARDFLVKTIFKTEQARKSLDTLFPRDPRDADILVWSEKWIGVHARCGALIFARRLHECVPLNEHPSVRNALRDAVAVANRTRALRLFATATAAAATTSSSTSTSAGRDSAEEKIPQPAAVFSDSRIVRFPIGWITPHAWKSMQARAFRFAMFVLRQAELDGKNNKGTVYLVAVKLMLRFITDATALTEGSCFSLVCGLPYNDDETREFVVLDFRDERLAPQVRLAVDRLIRISRGANWDPPNAAWGSSLIYTKTNPGANFGLIKKLNAPETISSLKVVACHEDVAKWNAAA